jgi:hypothetical protein
MACPVMFLLSVGSTEPRWMVPFRPVRNVTVDEGSASGLVAWVRASRSEPAPVSLVFITV